MTIGTAVLVPKASMDEYHGGIATQHDIWLSRQGFHVEAVPEAKTV